MPAQNQTHLYASRRILNSILLDTGNQWRLRSTGVCVHICQLQSSLMIAHSLDQSNFKEDGLHFPSPFHSRFKSFQNVVAYFEIKAQLAIGGSTINAFVYLVLFFRKDIVLVFSSHHVSMFEENTYMPSQSGFLPGIILWGAPPESFLGPKIAQICFQMPINLSCHFSHEKKMLLSILMEGGTCPPSPLWRKPCGLYFSMT